MFSLCCQNRTRPACTSMQFDQAVTCDFYFTICLGYFSYTTEAIWKKCDRGTQSSYAYLIINRFFIEFLAELWPLNRKGVSYGISLVILTFSTLQKTLDHPYSPYSYIFNTLTNHPLIQLLHSLSSDNTCGL